MSNYKTAESVSPNHPDKICDRISDALLDAYLEQDPKSRVAIDVAGGHGKVFVTGEVTTNAKKVDVVSIVKRVAGDIDVTVHIAEQSPEIANGVDTGGAGDQGIMVGYATNETEQYLPLEVVLSRHLNQYLYKKWPHDGKTQVTTKDGEIVSVVASFQHAKQSELLARVKHWLRQEPLAKLAESLEFHINPAGDWNQGGFDADAGLTGRKLIVDNYGPRVPIGGGAFSGKDPSKVDRSAAYACRWVAKNVVAAGFADRCEVQVAYAIGIAQPVSIRVDTFGTGKVSEDKLTAAIRKVFDLRPAAIIKDLELKKPVFRRSAAYGHFGRAEFAWERTNRVEALRKELG